LLTRAITVAPANDRHRPAPSVHLVKRTAGFGAFASLPREPSLLAGMLFDGDGNRMTPSHAIRKGTRYRYYVSHGLITKDQSERSAGLRTPAGEIEQVVTSRAR